MFKNLIFFQISKLSLDADTLSDLLSANPFNPCPKAALRSEGWLEPAGEGTGYVVESQDVFWLRLGVDKKSIPAKMVKPKLEERIKEFKEKHDAKPSKQEIQQFKEEIEMELTPLVFPSRDDIDVIISFKEGWMAVDASSDSKASAVLDQLREALEDHALNASILTPGNNASETMTKWLTSGEPPKGWTLTGDAVLKDSDGAITCKNQDLFSAEIEAHLDGGMKVDSIGAVVNENLKVTVNSKLVVKSIKPVAELKAGQAEMMNEAGEESLALLMQTQVILFKPVYRGLFESLTKVFNVQKAA